MNIHNIQNRNVLITYGWVRSSYAAMRSFTDYGLKVYISDETKIGMCQFSRMCKFSGKYASPFLEPDFFINDIVNIIKKDNINFLLPSHDETEIFAQRIEDIPKNVIVPIATHSKIKIANDKYLSTRLAIDTGIDTPKTLDYQKKECLLNLLEDGKKYVIKLRKGNSSKGVFYSENKDKTYNLLLELCRSYGVNEENLPVVQERIEGSGWGVSCLYWEGQRRAHFTHKRLKEKISTGGTSTIRVSKSNPIIEEMAFAILDKLGWHGLAMVEFKFNESTKDAWFIEINPRLWGSIHLAISSGIDFPILLYKASYGMNFPYPRQKEGVVARWYLGDMIVAASQFKKMKILSGIKSLTPGDCHTYDDIRKDDPLSFIGESSAYLYNLVKFRSFNPEKPGMLR